MLMPDIPVHLQDPTVATRRELVTGTLAAAAGARLTVRFEAPRFEVAAGDELVVYWQESRKFMQQSARALEVGTEDGWLTIDLERVGEAVSAEGREYYRVPCVTADITTRLADEEGCPLLDIGAMGFAVNSHAEHAVGDSVEVAVGYGDEDYAGTVCVQSVRGIGRGRTRYGMRYLDDERVAASLKRGLMKISLEVERQLLRNMSGV